MPNKAGSRFKVCKPSTKRKTPEVDTNTSVPTKQKNTQAVESDIASDVKGKFTRVLCELIEKVEFIRKLKATKARFDRFCLPKIVVKTLPPEMILRSVVENSIAEKDIHREFHRLLKKALGNNQKARQLKWTAFKDMEGLQPAYTLLKEFENWLINPNDLPSYLRSDMSTDSDVVWFERSRPAPINVDDEKTDNTQSFSSSSSSSSSSNTKTVVKTEPVD